MLHTYTRVQTNTKWHSILCDARLRLVALAAGITFMTGCDPVRTISHDVRVHVVDDHGVAVPNVTVSIKESWESWQSWGGKVAESEKDLYYRRWESDYVPWYRGVTDAQGNAAIAVTFTALDHTKGNEPPANRDFVSNREFMVKLNGWNGQEELVVVMKPGAVARGKHYTIVVQEIEKPKYVQ